MPNVSLALRDLVRVVRKGVVDTSAVNVKVLTKVLHADAGALDVPAGIADAKRTVPLKLLRIELRFRKPEHKVSLVPLVFVALDALSDAYGKVLFLKIVENIVLLELRGVKIHVPARGIGISFLEQRGYNLYKIVNATRRRLNYVRGPYPELSAVLKECVGVESRDLKHRLVLAARTLQHLVLTRIGITREMSDVGDVHHARDLVARITEIAVKHVLHNVGAKVSYVCKMVDRGAAGVHLHLSLFDRSEFFLCPCQRIVYLHISLLSCLPS